MNEFVKRYRIAVERKVEAGISLFLRFRRWPQESLIEAPPVIAVYISPIFRKIVVVQLPEFVFGPGSEIRVKQETGEENSNYLKSVRHGNLMASAAAPA